MTELEVLTEGFRYDRWANLRWLEVLERDGRQEPDFSVFSHILAAQMVWLLRCQGESPKQMPSPEPSLETLELLHSQWMEVLAAGEDRVISYSRFAGQRFDQPLSEIARHVVNHGTYHRGELRGLYRARGCEDYPETDLILFDR